MRYKRSTKALSFLIPAVLHGTQSDKELFITARDSMIQRFEYCSDLLWKIIKMYLEEIEKINLQITSPRGIVREAIKINVIKEKDGVICMDIIANRNLTSHVYHQETAHDIAQKIPLLYSEMKIIVDKIKKNIR